VARDPSAEEGYWYLAEAMSSLGEPKDAVAEALRQRASRLRERRRSDPEAE